MKAFKVSKYLFQIVIALSLYTSMNPAMASFVREQGECLVNTTPAIAAALFNEKEAQCNGKISFTWQITTPDDNGVGKDQITTSLTTHLANKEVFLRKYTDSEGYLNFNNIRLWQVEWHGWSEEPPIEGVNYNVEITTENHVLKPIIEFKTASNHNLISNAICKVIRTPTPISNPLTLYTSGGEAAWNKAKTPSGCAIS
ncbi:MAG: hypothetical protein K0R14_2096 [Burkholderiales bacterium]|jgi:hypothetical protein|nr:hypothetical protein [Burkholderiales bacterium]